MITYNDVPSEIEKINKKLSRIESFLLSDSDHQKKPLTPLRPEGAAKFCDLSKASIYRLVSAREIPFHKQGAKLYFFEEELLEWIKSGRKISK